MPLPAEVHELAEVHEKLLKLHAELLSEELLSPDPTALSRCVSELEDATARLELNQPTEFKPPLAAVQRDLRRVAGLIEYGAGLLGAAWAPASGAYTAAGTPEPLIVSSSLSISG